MKIKITKDMRDRLIDLAASGPLLHKNIDMELKALGLIQNYDGFAYYVEITQEASKNLYDDSGRINKINFEVL